MRSFSFSKSMVVRPFFMLFFPLIAYWLFTIATYPLAPHCSLGNSLMGCTPTCEFINGSFTETPCFHNAADTLQRVVFALWNYFYFALFFALLIAIRKLGKKKLWNVFSFFAFYPLHLASQIRNTKDNILRKTFALLLLLPLLLEWVLGYVILFEFLTGISPF